MCVYIGHVSAEASGYIDCATAQFHTHQYLLSPGFGVVDTGELVESMRGVTRRQIHHAEPEAALQLGGPVDASVLKHT